MEKDKSRSVVRVSMLACSVLLLSALFIGCGPCTPQPKPCLHPSRVAFYCHALPGDSAHTWYATWTDTAGVPSPQPCPWDSASTACDSLKCETCKLLLYRPPCTHPVQAAYYHHAHPDTTTFTWYESPPPPPSDTTSAPADVQCPIDDQPRPCDYVKCLACGAQLWPD